MTDIKELESIIKSHGFSIEQALEWGKQTYPRFASNQELILKLFLKNKGLELPRPIRGQITPINQLQAETWCNIQGVVVDIASTRTYFGCPECLKKCEEGICPTHGKKTVELTWTDIEVGDPTDTIMVTLNPRMSIPQQGSEVVIRGFLDPESEAFRAFQIQPAPKPASQPAPSVPAPPTPAPAPTPAPTMPTPTQVSPQVSPPVSAPVSPPVPTPTPILAPAPVPAPQPIQAPAPAPAPTPVPTPAPAPSPTTPPSTGLAVPDVSRLIDLVKVSAMMRKKEADVIDYLSKVIQKYQIPLTAQDLIKQAGVQVAEDGTLKA